MIGSFGAPLERGTGLEDRIDPALSAYTHPVPGVDQVSETHAPLEWETPLFHQAIAQFEQAFRTRR